jgi:N-acetylglutamate synthase-like GNAT family acetyltransferase
VVSIRRANSADGPIVFGLLAQLGEQYTPNRTVFDTAFADAVADANDHILFVADDDGEVVGYALATIARLFYTNGDAAQLQELVVDENSRARGIGSQLVSAIEEECLKRGVRQLTVATLKSASFYERLDYRSTADFLKKRFDE